MIKLNVLYEDEDVLAIEKPTGVLSVPDRFDISIENMKHAVQRQYKEALVVHRLDKDTSGVIMFARSDSAQRILQAQFENRTIEKTYRAICYGRPNALSGVIETAIQPHKLKKGRMTVSKKGKHAVTHWEVVEQFNHYCLMSIQPKTGRTHQIRVHMEHLGHAIVADPFYGPGSVLLLSNLKPGFKRKPDREERPLLGRTALHAASLSYTSSKSGETVSINCPLPKDMRAALNQLRKHGKQA